MFCTILDLWHVHLQSYAKIACVRWAQMRKTITVRSQGELDTSVFTSILCCTDFLSFSTCFALWSGNHAVMICPIRARHRFKPKGFAEKDISSGTPNSVWASFEIPNPQNAWNVKMLFNSKSEWTRRCYCVFWLAWDNSSWNFWLRYIYLAFISDIKFTLCDEKGQKTLQKENRPCEEKSGVHSRNFGAIVGNSICRGWT